MSAKSIKSREVRGPGVAGFGIIGRSVSGKPVDQIIIDRRAKEDAAAEQAELAKETAKISFQNSWENSLATVSNKGAARRAMQEAEIVKRETIEVRREKFVSLCYASLRFQAACTPCGRECHVRAGDRRHS
jgi:hypothetical protein